MIKKINELEKIGLFSTKVNKVFPDNLTYSFEPFDNFKFGLEHGKEVEFNFGDFVNLVYDRYVVNPFMMNKKNRKVSYKEYLESKKIVEMYEKGLSNLNDLKKLKDCDLSGHLRTLIQVLNFDEDVETIGDMRKIYEREGRNGMLKYRNVGKVTLLDLDNLLSMTI